jgi:hypothetical protein
MFSRLASRVLGTSTAGRAARNINHLAKVRALGGYGSKVMLLATCGVLSYSVSKSFQQKSYSLCEGQESACVDKSEIFLPAGCP